MTSRLDHWGISDYSITKEGYDTVRVRLRTEENSSTEYDYLSYYLPFSGGHISVDASMDEEDDYSYDTDWANMFEGQTATIEYISGETVPVVAIPVNHEGEDGALGQLLDYCESKYQAADESNSTSEVNCYVVLWSNKQEGDNFNEASGSNGATVDQNMARRFLGAEVAGNAWFEEDEEDDNYTRFQYIPSSAAFNNSAYDSSQAEAAYKAAFFYMSLFNAEDYADIGAGYDVSFAFGAVAAPEVENLVSSGLSLTPAVSATMIATIVGLIVSVLVVALFYRMGALALTSSMMVSLIATLLLIGYFHAQFGIGMLLGLGLTALVSLFGGIYYLAKLKDEIYKGRSLKKANQEAGKKAFWPTIDAGILSVVVGLCIYFLVPAETSMCGLALVVGGFFATICSLFLTRFQMWLLCNDGDASTHMGRLFGIDKEKVPDLLKEEKQTFFGLFAKTNFMKPWKATAIVATLLGIASIAGLATFSALNGGTPFSIDDSSDTSRVYITYRLPEGSTNDVFNSIDDIDNGRDGIFNIVYDDEGESIADTLLESVEMVRTSITFTGEGDYDVLNFVVNLEGTYAADDETVYTVTTTGYSEEFTGLEAAIEGALLTKNVDEESYSVSLKNVTYDNLTPGFTDVCLGIGISLVCALVYLSIRFRPSRGVSVTLFAGLSAFISLGLLSLSRLATTPISAIGGIAAMFVTFLIALFILGKEREVVLESHVRDKSDLGFRAKCLLDANGQGAAEAVVFAIIAAYVFVCFLAFGPVDFALGYAVALLGSILSIALVLILISPSSLFLAKQFSKIHLDLSWRKDAKKGQGSGKRSAEPEEAVFIGIND